MNIYELDNESVIALQLLYESDPDFGCPIHNILGKCDECKLQPMMDKFELVPCDEIAKVIVKLRELNRG